MSDYDVLVIGAGHNGLACAAYLARAGYHVGVFEQQDVVGGAVVTREIIPGFRFDLGGSVPNSINLAPIIDELKLKEYGYEDVFLDPQFFCPYPDGSHLFLWRDVDRTCESIAALSDHDAEAYRRYARDWQPLLRVIVDAMNHSPSPFNLARTLGGGFLTRVHAPLRMAGLLAKSSAALMQTYFSNPKVRAAINWTGIQSGVGIDEPFGAMTAAWHLTYHLAGMSHARGGAGALTQAMARVITAHGGELHTNCRVAAILSRGKQAAGIRLQDGSTVSAARVVSAIHIRTTLGLLDEAVVPARKKIERLDLGNGSGMAVRLALSELPDYAALPGQPGPQHTALQWICPDLDYARRAHADFLSGRVSTDPLLGAMTFSAADPTLAPPGRHTLFLWGQYYPYELADGRDWDDLREQAADRLLDKLAEYAPNVRSAVIGRFIETPPDLERMFGLHRANITHLPMDARHMFMLRPVPEYSQYHGPLKGLYISGASTHPGGGITGQPGRNTARVILQDLARKP